MNIYHSRWWKKKRENILRRDDYLCQISIRYGKLVEATTVHHIYPVEFYPELAKVNWNLISLCQEEHNKLHQRAKHNLTDAGVKLMRSKKREYLNWCKQKNTPPHFDF